MLNHGHLAFAHLGNLGVDGPLDMALAQLRLHQPLGIADPAEPHVANVRFAADVVHRHLVTQLAATQVGVDDHCELVAGAKATGSLHGTDHDRPGILEEFLIGFPRGLRMRGRADRLGMAILGTAARHFVEGELGTRADQQIIVVHAFAAAGDNAIGFGVDAGHAIVDVADIVLADMLGHRHGYFLTLAPADRQPRVGRREAERFAQSDEGNVVVLAQRVAQLVSRAHATQSSSHYNELRHDALRLWIQSPAASTMPIRSRLDPDSSQPRHRKST